MVKKIISIVLVLSLVFGGGYYTALQLIPKEDETMTGPTYATKPVKKGDIKVGVNITGELYAQSGSSVTAPKPDGIDDTIEYVVEELYVKENQAIKKDEPVALLSSSNLSDIYSDYTDQIEDIQDTIDSKLNTLSKKLNREIDNIDDVNPYDGIVIAAPIRGRLSELKVEEGEKVEDSLIAKIVDDSRFKISFKVTTNEITKIKKGDSVSLKFSNFEGYYPGVVKELNQNAVPNDDKVSYVYWGIIEADNPGLVQPGMNVSINLEQDGVMTTTLTYGGTVDSYVNQSKVYTTMYSDSDRTILATEVFVNENDFIEEGDTIVRIAGSDVTDEIQTDIDAIRDEYRKIEDIQKKIDAIDKLSGEFLVKAPNDGMVAWLNYRQGDSFSVSPESDNWSLQLVNVYNINDLYIHTEVNDIDAYYISQGAKVDVTVDAIAGKVFSGEVMNKSSYSDRDGKTKFYVEISVVGEEGLAPGMSTNCFIDAGESLDTLIIPIEAVYEEDGLQKVEVLKDDGTVEVVVVEIGLMNDKEVEVLSGLEEGQLVVTGSTVDLMPSQSVGNDNTLLPGKTQ